MAHSSHPATPDSALEIAVDVGGTFTDGVLLDTANHEILVAKSLTTPDDPGEGILNVVNDLLRQARDLRGPAVAAASRRLVHGTTLVTNTLLERRGARVALVVTEGTRDCLDIRRELRYDTYDLAIAFPPALVDRADRFPIGGRIGPAGQVWQELHEPQLDELAAQLARGGYEAVAVCLLHACANDAHEKAVAARLAQALPGVPVCTSAEVAREIGEYERMSTVAANAYVQPAVQRYLSALTGRLQALGLHATLDIMVSNGAFTTAELASRLPVRLLESGPAGGVLSAINCGQTDGVDRVLAFDMGGTTAKACVAVDAKPSITHVFEFGRVQRFKRGSGLPAVVPSIDLIEIGAGGGSIASVNALGLLQVGPQSAGSQPGPACYGFGGDSATVTDADLLLGYLDATTFLGGRMQLDTERARDALAALGAQLGLTAQQAAWGIHNIVNEKMAAAARTHIAEQGLDARRFTMIATGGAGPVHAVDVARRLGVREVICPIASGVGSCLGFLAAPARADRSWSTVEPLAAVDVPALLARLAVARASIAADLTQCGLAAAAIRWAWSAEMRYAGQGNSVEVDLGGAAQEFDIAQALGGFESEYTRLYGRTVPGGVVEAVTWRLVGGSAQAVRPYRLAHALGPAPVAGAARRPIWLPGESHFAEVPVHRRDALPPGSELRGPVVIAEPESTIVVAWPATVTVLPSGSIKVLLEGEL